VWEDGEERVGRKAERGRKRNGEIETEREKQRKK
jgi:hypothetical protein